MTKQEKIEYINQVWDKFENARNHGNGGSWWYPLPFVIAYNVKVYDGVSIEGMRKRMTERQNAHYSDEMLYDEIYHEQEWQARDYIDSIKEFEGVEDAYFAGRMGGWFEVKYSKNGLSYVENNENMADVNYFYKKAKELEKNEAEVKENIKYIGSEEAEKDMVDGLLSDEDIGEVYKSEIKNFTNKLK